MSKHIQSFFWLIPFFCFFLGYMIIRLYMSTPIIHMPNLIGTQIHHASLELSNLNLNCRILDQKEDPDLPEGTIINQVPSHGQKIKPNQSIFLVLSKHPEQKPIPNLVGTFIQDIHDNISDNQTRVNIVTVPSSAPKNLCIAQICEQENTRQTLTVYGSQGSHKPIIWPNFRQQNLAYVLEFLASYDINPIVTFAHPYTDEEYAHVVDQRPLPGTIISLNDMSKISAHLHVE